jgi:hypothetical protein
MQEELKEEILDELQEEISSFTVNYNYIGYLLNNLIFQDNINNNNNNLINNKTCPITLEEITYLQNYCICNCCKYKFKELAIKEWIYSKLTCPMCRAYWSNFVVYVNYEK